MEFGIDFASWPLRGVLEVLLADRATGRSIIWATDPPPELEGATDRSPITAGQLLELGGVRPRATKDGGRQQARTRKRGEVFTPAWVCCMMNNYLDEQWFGRKRALPARMVGQGWVMDGGDGRVRPARPEGTPPAAAEAVEALPANPAATDGGAIVSSATPAATDGGAACPAAASSSTPAAADGGAVVSSATPAATDDGDACPVAASSAIPAAADGDGPEPICFPRGKRWQAYVDSRRLEICCGEAPFLCSRYDAATGEPIPVERRIGLLDRKLRVVSENAGSEADWQRWARRAFESVYGYEYQGDSLLLARANLLLSYAEHRQRRWGAPAGDAELRAIAEVISWNLWQMDGLKRTVPFGKLYREEEQLNWFAFIDQREEAAPVPCRIRNWRQNRIEIYGQQEERRYPMKFDYVIGNPPYQEETVGEQKTFAPPRLPFFHGSILRDS